MHASRRNFGFAVPRTSILNHEQNKWIADAALFSAMQAAASGTLQPSLQQQLPQLMDSLVALLHQLLATRISDAVLVTLQSRGIEAFAKLLALRLDVAVPIVQSMFDLVHIIPQQQHGHLPPPEKVTIVHLCRWFAFFHCLVLGYFQVITKGGKYAVA